jgi:Asp-tRNA(Asn)/Glu-tRNA(Gln) amidotransferase A subunit family amidase
MTIAGQLRRFALGKTTAVAQTAGLLGTLSVDETHAEAARITARDSDARRGRGLPIGPLEGIAVAVASGIQAADPVTEAGAAARLRRAGAVVLAGMPSETVTETVADGSLPLGLIIDRGSDGPVVPDELWALRPTKGLIGASGLSSASWTFDAVMPLAANAKDLAHGLFVLAGTDPADPFSDARPLMAPRRGGLPGLKLAVPEELPLSGLDRAIVQAFQAALSWARALGVTITAASVPGWDPGHLQRATGIVIGAELASQFGDRRDAVPNALRAYYDTGLQVSGPDLASAYRRIALTRPACLFALDGIDGLILPAIPGIGAACLAAAAGLPMVTFPLGDSPFAVHLIGAPYADARLIALAGALSKGQVAGGSSG